MIMTFATSPKYRNCQSDKMKKTPLNAFWIVSIITTILALKTQLIKSVALNFHEITFFLDVFRNLRV